MLAPVGYEWRRRIRNSFRIIWVLWALFWLTGGLASVFDDAKTVSTSETVVFVLFFLGFGFGPLVCHLWWSRSHPLTRDAGDIEALALVPGAGLHAKLDRINELAEELRQRAWSTPEDRRAISERVKRLRELVDVDEASVARGGTRSTVIEPEIDRLLMQVGGILDAAINSAAVAPGDSELDRRLQDQLEAHQARQRAINEVEGRPMPGH